MAIKSNAHTAGDHLVHVHVIPAVVEITMQGESGRDQRLPTTDKTACSSRRGNTTSAADGNVERGARYVGNRVPVAVDRESTGTRHTTDSHGMAVSEHM